MVGREEYPEKVTDFTKNRIYHNELIYNLSGHSRVLFNGKELINTPGSIRFLPLQRKRFPCYDLALTALEEGDNYPCALNGAGEVAVGAFLAGRIGFTQIADTIEEVLQNTKREDAKSYDALVDTDKRARALAREYIDKKVL